MTAAQQPHRELKWEPHWITPPELYKELDAEFHFDYDPCPFPKPKDYDGIKAEWGTSNYVNPPFHRENGIGPTAFVRKAIEENKKGKTVVLTIPTQSYVNLLLEAGAEVRSLGRVKWLHTVTREPMKGPSPITAFILRTRPHTPAQQPEHCEHYELCRMYLSLLKEYLPNGKCAHIWCEDTIRLIDGKCPHDTRSRPHTPPERIPMKSCFGKFMDCPCEDECGVSEFCEAHSKMPSCGLTDSQCYEVQNHEKAEAAKAERERVLDKLIRAIHAEEVMDERSDYEILVWIQNTLIPSLRGER